MIPTARIERRFTSTPAAAGSARATSSGGAGKVRGYGAVFYRKGDAATVYRLAPDVEERIAPGAFDRAVKEDPVALLYNHDANMLLGRTTARTLRLRVDATGLHYEGDLPPTSVGRDVGALLARGDLSGASFSFSVVREEWTREDKILVRTLREVRLYDVGPVTFPAYAGASSGTGAAPGTTADDAVLEAGRRAAKSGTVRDDDNPHVAAAKRRNQILDWMAWNPDGYDPVEAARAAARNRNLDLIERSGPSTP